MITPHSYKGKHIAVFGLGRSGLTAAKALVKGGAHVYAWDDMAASRKNAEGEGVALTDLTAADWSKFEALVLSPGVPHKLPKPHWSAERANAAGVPIICDIEIFAAEVNARAPDRRPKIIAITGTNGKSTTTSLIGHILTQCGRDAQIGGNIGRGVLDLESMHGGSHYVIELSSYQLERTYSLRADAAVFLNLTPDHIDRHGDMAGYEAAKRRVFDNQISDDAVIIGVDDAAGKRIASDLIAANGRRIVPISGRRSLGRGVSVIKGKLYCAMSRSVDYICDLNNAVALEGEHNWQNAAAAYAAVRALGLDPKAIGAAILSFPGLAHRMENIGEVAGVRYVNDSKATNADAALQALKSYDNIYWIAGGVAKDGGIAPLTAQFKNISRAYLIGESAENFQAVLKKNKVAAKISGDMEKAVLCATRDALASKAENPIILLSPACASFDQYKNFEIRGDAFRVHAEKIIAMFEAEKNGSMAGGHAA
ncbi:MAG: UDP-N-acetylmuramoyl-L-alanine--D-glutamate ligase [Robiginitomaculum sp.]